MTDTFINTIQLNTSSINCDITSEELDTPYNVLNTPIPTRIRGVNYVTSAQVQNYRFNFTLFCTSAGVFLDLINKLTEVYEDVQTTQVTDRLPILISTDDTPVYFEFTSVYIVVDSLSYELRGADGNRHINIVIEGTVLGAPISQGGTIDPEDFWGLGAPRGITEFEVGLMEVGL